MSALSINERIEICKKCPIYSVDGRCNSKLWLNPNTNEVSVYSKPGFVRGCNCIIQVKAKNLNNHCVAGKW